MNDLVKLHDGKVIVTSKDISDRFGKGHRDVMRAIESLDCSDGFRSGNFSTSSYTTSQNKVLPCYEMTKDGFAFLCMGFNGKKAGEWKEKYIRAFNKMESLLLGAPKTMESLNSIVKKIEENKDLASLHGRELAKYKIIKREQEEQFNDAVNEAQLTLGIKVD